MKALVSALLMGSMAQATPLQDYDMGLLLKSKPSLFTGDDKRAAAVQDMPPILLHANYGTVILRGRGWSFDDNIVESDDLIHTRTRDIDEDKILTIVGSYEGAQYDVEFIKHYQARQSNLRIIGVHPIIPEPSTGSAIAGVFAGAVAFLKRKTS